MFWHSASRVDTRSARWPLHMAAPSLLSAVVILPPQSDYYLAGDRHRCAYGQSRRRVGVAGHSAFRRMRAYPIGKRHFDTAFSTLPRQPEFGGRRTDLGPFNLSPDTSRP